MPDNAIIEQAREAALYSAISNARRQQDEHLRARFDTLVDSPLLQAEVKGLADAAADAAMRVLLEELLKAVDAIPIERRMDGYMSDRSPEAVLSDVCDLIQGLLVEARRL